MFLYITAAASSVQCQHLWIIMNFLVIANQLAFFSVEERKLLTSSVGAAYWWRADQLHAGGDSTGIKQLWCCLKWFIYSCVAWQQSEQVNQELDTVTTEQSSKLIFEFYYSLLFEETVFHWGTVWSSSVEGEAEGFGGAITPVWHGHVALGGEKADPVAGLKWVGAPTHGADRKHMKTTGYPFSSAQCLQLKI